MSERGAALKLFRRAYECQERGELEDAARLYQASIATFPTAEAHTYLGWVYALDRRFDDAIAECKRAIAADPTFGNPYNDIGAYLMELGRDADAVPWFERALAAERYEARYFPHINLARIHEARGDYTAALGELSRALELAPDYEPAITAFRQLQARVN
jgi:tetratricopeptide (TPR) repeat protein